MDAPQPRSRACPRDLAARFPGRAGRHPDIDELHRLVRRRVGGAGHPAGGHDLADGGTDALVMKAPPVRLAVPDVDVAQPSAAADDKVNHQPFRRGAVGGGTDLGTDLGIVTFAGWHVPGERVAHVTLPTLGIISPIRYMSLYSMTGVVK